MKIGLAGKGGAGKTVLAALLVQAYASRGQQVLAVDTDTDPNLGLSLGLDRSELRAVRPIPRSLTTGTGEGRLTTAELLDTYAAATPAGPLLLHAVGVLEAGAGCACASHLAARSLLGRTIEAEIDLAVVDMAAGLEHLSRAGGTLAYADALVVVMEPSRVSVRTAARVCQLADELGIPRVYPVGNKVASGEEAAFLWEAGAGCGLAPVAVVPDDPAIRAAERSGEMMRLEQAREVVPVLDELITLLDSPDERRAALRRELGRLEERLAGLDAS